MRTWAEQHPKTVWVFLNFFVFFAFFVPVSYNTDPDRAISMALGLDLALPFVPWTFWIYSFAYLSTFVVLFVIRSGRLFHYAGFSFCVTVLISVLFYLVIPVTTRDFRPIATGFDDSTFLGWCLRLNWFLDRPYNCFPSLHVSAAFIAGFSCLKAHRGVGIATLILAVAISISAMLMKQHYLADLLLGLALAAGCHRWILSRYDPATDPEGDPPHFPAKIMALFVPAYVTLVLIAFTLFQVGWRPWVGRPVY